MDAIIMFFVSCMALAVSIHAPVMDAISAITQSAKFWIVSIHAPVMDAMLFKVFRQPYA